MKKPHLLLLILFTTVYFTGCSSDKHKINSEKKIQVVTLDDKISYPVVNPSKKNKLQTDKETHIETYEQKHLPPQLISYMEGALVNNKKILEAQHGILATNEEHNIQKAAFKPVIDSVSGISGRPCKYWGAEQPRVTKIQAESTYSTALRTRWNLFRGGADIAKLESTDKQIEAKWKEYDSLVQDTLQQVTELYFNIVAKQKEIENINSLIKARKESINVAKQMNIAGVAKEVDVAQAQAAYAESEAKLSVAEAQEQSYMAQLSELTGMPVSGKLQQSTKYLSISLSENDALEIAKKFNPKVIAAQANYFAAVAELKEPVDSFIPSIDLEGGYYVDHVDSVSGTVGQSAIESSSTSRYRHNPAIALNLTVPIYSGGSGLAKKRQSREKLTKARVTRERVLMETRTGIKCALEMIEAANENISSSLKAINARTLSLNATKEEHQAGVKIMKDVLDEQQKLFEAQQIMIEAVKDKFVNQFKLLGFLGRLNPKYLNINGSDFNYVKEFEHQKRGLITRASEKEYKQNYSTRKSSTGYLSE